MDEHLGISHDFCNEWAVDVTTIDKTPEMQRLNVRLAGANILNGGFHNYQR